MNRREFLAFPFLTATNVWGEQRQLKTLKMTVLAMKTHGLSIVLTTPGGKTWLIDTGLRPTGDYYAARDSISPFLKASGVREIDGVLISHPHGDHYGGVPYLLDNFKVGQLVDAGYAEIGGTELETYRKLRARFVGSGGRSVTVRQGDALSLDPALNAEVIWPPDGLYRPDPAKKDDALYNGNSVVLRVKHGANVFLFPGDCHGIAKLQARIGAERLLCDVLVAPHHGLNSTPAMAEATKPRIVLVSSLREYSNPTIFPARLTENAFATTQSKVYTTWSVGNITVESDGKRISVTTEKNPVLSPVPAEPAP